MATKENLKALERALDRAADLSRRHAMAVQKASHAFEKAFGVEVPELTGGDEANTVGSLFNNYVNYGENMSHSSSTEKLVEEMNMLMERAFR